MKKNLLFLNSKSVAKDFVKKNVKKAIPFMLLFVLLGSTLPCFGASNNWIGPDGGDWNTVTNWSIHVPVSSDAVVIPEGSIVVISGTAECNNLTINTGAVVTNNGSLSIGNLLSGAGTFINGSSAALNIGGDATITTLTATAEGNTIDYKGTAAQLIKGTTYYNLAVSGSGIKTLTGNASLNGLLTVKSGSELDLGSNNLSTRFTDYINSDVILECGATEGSKISGTGTLNTEGILKVVNISAGSSGAVVTCQVIMPFGLFIDVDDDGTPATDLTISGVISGDGAPYKLGTGTLMLSGLNTYKETTWVETGILKLGSAGSGSYSPLGIEDAIGTYVKDGGLLDLNGYTLATSEILKLTGNGISDGGALINSSADPVTYPGEIELRSSVIIGKGDITLPNIIYSTSTDYSLTKTGTGTLTLSFSLGNSFSGGLIINEGTVQLGHTNTIPDQPLILQGGTFRTGVTTGLNETLKTLELKDNSAIHLGTGSHSLRFSASSGVTWTSGKTLTISGWAGTAGSSGTAGKIFFGTSTGTLTSDQLSRISFEGYTGTPILLSTGELVPQNVPVITVGTLSPFGSQCINTASEIQSYVVSGSSLTDAIVVTPPAGFEISVIGGSLFDPSPYINLNPSSGLIEGQTIYVRFKPASAQAYSANITHTSTGATTQNVAVSGTGIAAPVADFTGTPASVTTGGSVTFTDNSTNLPTSWSWSFPGGSPSSSTSQNPSVTYSTAGTYSVSLTSANSCGSDEEIKTDYITVNDPSNVQSFTTPGTASFTVPDDVYEVTVQVWGGGGRGGTGYFGPYGGGGGGAYSKSTLIVTPGTSFPVRVGSGSTSNFTGGEDSWFSTAATVMAKGGSSCANVFTGGNGGQASAGYGEVKYSGGKGADANQAYMANYSGGGGSSAGTGADGNSASGHLGAVAPAGGGSGGNGIDNSNVENISGPGIPGSVPGGGGGGAFNDYTGYVIYGGSGASGKVVVSWEVGCGTPPPMAEAQSFCSGDGPVVSNLVSSGLEGSAIHWYDSGESVTPLEVQRYWQREIIMSARQSMAAKV